MSTRESGCECITAGIEVGTLDFGIKCGERLGGGIGRVASESPDMIGVRMLKKVSRDSTTLYVSREVRLVALVGCLRGRTWRPVAPITTTVRGAMIKYRLFFFFFVIEDYRKICSVSSMRQTLYLYLWQQIGRSCPFLLPTATPLNHRRSALVFKDEKFGLRTEGRTPLLLQQFGRIQLRALRNSTLYNGVMAQT